VDEDGNRAALRADNLVDGDRHGGYCKTNDESHKVVFLNLNKSLEKSYHIIATQERRQDGYHESQRANNHT
jgi:hypothetical protein